MQIMDLGACLFGCCLNSHSVQFALALLRITVRHLWPKGKPRSTLSPQSSFVIIRPPCSSCSTSPILLASMPCSCCVSCRCAKRKPRHRRDGRKREHRILQLLQNVPRDLARGFGLSQGAMVFLSPMATLPAPQRRVPGKKTLVQVPRRFCPPYTFLKAPCVSNSGDYDFLLLWSSAALTCWPHWPQCSPAANAHALANVDLSHHGRGSNVQPIRILEVKGDSH